MQNSDRLHRLLISKQWKQSINNARVGLRLSADCDSDHNLVVLTMRLYKITKKRIIKKLLLNLAKLRDGQGRE